MDRWFGLVLGWVALGMPGGWARAQPVVEVPWVQQRDSAVRATLRDYDARLRARFQQRLEAWLRDFVDRRAAQRDVAAEQLARLAAQIRDRREVSWVAVGQDAQFQTAARAAVAELLAAGAIRSELALWARQVERDTRLEMVRCFQQIVAWDLGMRFDDRLRGKVVAAVRAIPVEQLVADDVSQTKLVTAIEAGLPGVLLSDAQKASLAAAAGELARRAAQWVTVRQLQLPADWAELLSGVAAMGASWAAHESLEWLDRKWTGEPKPATIAARLTAALEAWNRENLIARLGPILRAYRVQVLQFVQSEAEAAARTGGIETAP